MTNPKLETLRDRFDGTALNTSLWNSVTPGGVTFDAVNDQAVIAVGTGSGTFNNLGALGPYDATGSYLYAQVNPAPNGNGGITTYMKLVKDGTNQLQLQLNSSLFQVYLQTAGSFALAATLPTYDPHQHRWWRISESGGNFLVATAPDGYNWTTQATIPYTWASTAVQVVFQTGTSDTEPSSLVTTIAYVNTTSPASGQQNLNWPGIEFAWAPYWNCNGGDLPLDRYVEVTDRTRGTVSVSRGRQYELDQVRSGEASLTLANSDGALDPNNVTGPWYGHIQPYQPYRVRAQWPPTRNLLTQVIATGGDLGGYSTGTIPGGASGIDVFTTTDSSSGQIAADATAWQGGRVFAMNVPSGTATQQAIWFTLQNGVLPGATYTAQFRVRNVTSSTSLTVDAFFSWYVVTGSAPTPTRSATQTLAGGSTSAWTTVTVAATAPANAAGMVIGVESGASVAATCTLQIDGVQLEKSGVASSWACPGVVYPMFGGYVERWPSQWTMSGTYGTVQPTAVDALSLLSQVQLSDPLTEEIQSRSPRFLYTLGDPSGSVSFTDSTGSHLAAPWRTSKNGPGSLTSGNSITAASSSGLYTGSSGTVVTIANPSPGAPGNAAATFISLDSAGVKGPVDPTSWTRVIAFKYTGPTPSDAAVIWSSSDPQRASNGVPSGTRIYLSINSSGHLVFVLSGPNGSSVTYGFGSTNVVDSNWHLAMFGYSSSLAQVMASLDGGLSAYFFGVSSSLTPTGIVCDSIGGLIDPVRSTGLGDNYQGDISYAAEFPNLFASSDITNVYNAWRSSSSGESTDARYNRILRYAGYTGLSSVQTGLTTSMGPASFDGQDALSALQSVVDTENGEHFVARDGTLTFRSRSARYNSLTPSIIFGENAGEIPYEDCQLDYDPTHLSNLVQVTQASTNQVFTAQDATSQTNYFPRTLTRTVNASSALECQDAAGYLLSRYKNALTRVQSLKLHPSANPALWPVLLGLELGTRVRVMRRPPSPAPAIQVECYVEGIQLSWDDHGEAFFTLQCSPADLTPYGLFAAFHTTLNGSPAAGVTSITINAGADNQNPAAAQLGQGQQLVLGLGTANQETVTIQSVGATSAGWTTATITLQAATTKSHTNGVTVCEPLPSGITDPTTWDATSKFDTAVFAY